MKHRSAPQMRLSGLMKLPGLFAVVVAGIGWTWTGEASVEQQHHLLPARRIRS